MLLARRGLNPKKAFAQAGRWLLLILVIAASLSTAAANPEPPSNDDFANAKVISVPSVEIVDLANATAESLEPSTSCDQGTITRGTAWYEFTPALPTPVTAVLTLGALAGVRADAPEGPTELPQLFHTHERATEPQIGIDAQGRIFYQAWNTTGGVFFLGAVPVLVSDDRGSTWRRVPADVSVVTGTGSIAESGDDTIVWGDPRLTVDRATGRVFKAVDVLSPDGSACAKFRYSEDGGATWEGRGCPKPSEYGQIAVGPAPAGAPQPSGYPNVVYWCAQFHSGIGQDQGAPLIANRVSCAKSLDGGATFGPAGEPAISLDDADGAMTNCFTTYGRPIVGPTGRLYVPTSRCFEEPAGSGRRSAMPALMVSDDEAKTWSLIVNEQPRTAVEQVRPGHDTPDGHVGIALAVDALVMTWLDRSDNMPWYGVSRDGGSTWTNRRVPLPADLAARPVDAAQPVIASVNARVGIAYVGANATGDWFPYLSVTDDILAASPVLAAYRVSAEPLWTGGGCGHSTLCGTNADFMDAAMADDGTFYATYTTGCSPASLGGGLVCSNQPWTGEGLIARVRA